MHPKDAEGITDRVDPDQTAPLGALIWVCTVCPDLSVRKLRNITVIQKHVTYLKGLALLTKFPLNTSLFSIAMVTVLYHLKHLEDNANKYRLIL